MLTTFLIDTGYLPASATARGIKYAIEVKTTTNSCETPFYMSNAQYNMVCSFGLRPLPLGSIEKTLTFLKIRNQFVDLASASAPPERLYLICRVYNLGRGSIGMRVLVNPKQLRRDGTLDFAVDTWSVVFRG